MCALQTELSCNKMFSKLYIFSV